MNRSAALCCTALLTLSAPLLLAAAPAPRAATASAPAAADEAGCAKARTEGKRPHAHHAHKSGEEKTAAEKEAKKTRHAAGEHHARTEPCTSH